MVWIPKFTGLPTLSDLKAGEGDSYAAGVFTFGTVNAFRAMSDSSGNAPIAYVDLATIGANPAAVLRVTSRFTGYTTIGTSGLGAVLYSDRANASYVKVDNQPGSDDGTQLAIAVEADVLNFVGSLGHLALPLPYQVRIYWNGTASPFVIPDPGFSSFVVAAGAQDFWYSTDDGSTWTHANQLQTNRPIGITPTRAGALAEMLHDLSPGSTLTFSNLEVVENAPAGITVDSVSPAKVSSAGGDAVTIAITVTGPSLVGADLEVTIGGEPAYGGQGKGYVPQLDAGDTVTVAVPPLAEGSHDVFVRAIVAGLDDTLASGLTVLERNFGTAAYEMRRMFPRWQGVGPRKLEDED
jgi:hypothetical protein